MIHISHIYTNTGFNLVLSARCASQTMGTTNTGCTLSASCSRKVSLAVLECSLCLFTLVHPTTMDDENDGVKVSEAFLSNENPFIFSDETFGSKDLKTKLDAIQSLQPPFIPFAIDQAELKSSLRQYYEKHEEIVSEVIRRYFESRNMENIDYELFCQNKDDENVVDLLIKVKQIKLYNKQAQLRERVYLGLKEIMTVEQMEHAHLCKIPDDEKDAAIVDMLERKFRTERHN